VAFTPPSFLPVATAARFHVGWFRKRSVGGRRGEPIEPESHDGEVHVSVTSLDNLDCSDATVSLQFDLISVARLSWRATWE